MARFEDTIARSLKRLRSQSGFDMTYHRKDGSEISLTSVLKGTKKWRFEDENMLSQHLETQDLIFAVDQFTGFERDVIEPLAGDLVSQSSDDGVDWFEVISVNKERVWKFSDPNKTTLRVHTVFLRHAS